MIGVFRPSWRDNISILALWLVVGMLPFGAEMRKQKLIKKAAEIKKAEEGTLNDWVYEFPKNVNMNDSDAFSGSVGSDESHSGEP